MADKGTSVARGEKDPIRNISTIIRIMHEEAWAKGAAVFRAEEGTAGDPFRILIFTMLSARTKDSTTMDTVERLFSKADTPSGIAKMPIRRIEKLIFGVGFYRTKARHLKGICKRIMARGGHVPDTLEELLELPGVGRKTANIVLARAFGRRTIGVDVHVHRISNRMGLVRTEKPAETENVLMKLIPPKIIRRFNRDMVAYGQTICLPRNPMCRICRIRKWCMRRGVTEGSGSGIKKGRT